MRPQSPLVPPLRWKYLFQQPLWVDSTPLPAIVSPLVAYRLGPLSKHFKFQQRVAGPAQSRELASASTGGGIASGALDIAPSLVYRPYPIGLLGRHFRFQQAVLTSATTQELATNNTGVGFVSATIADSPAVPPLRPYTIGPLGRFFRVQQRLAWGATGKELAANPAGVGLTTAAVSDLAAAVPLRQFRLSQLKYQQRPSPVTIPVDVLAASATGVGAMTASLGVAHSLATAVLGIGSLTSSLGLSHALSALAIGVGKARAQMEILPRPPFELLRWDPLLKGYVLGRRPRR